MTPRTDQPTKRTKIPYNKGMIGSGKLDDDKSQGDVSKYSAVVFTNPDADKFKINAKEDKPEISKKETEEEEDYSDDDDFEDDFEPYETSNEDEDNNK
jgi:hypothetical protein